MGSPDIFERTYDDVYQTSKVVFGAEPKDYEVYGFILKNFENLKFSSISIGNAIQSKKINPKRLQRKIKKECKNTVIGTKAQLSLKLQYEKKEKHRGH